MTTAGAIWDAAIAPFANTVGWQGFAYGLLGLRTTRRLLTFARSFIGRGTAETEKESSEEEQRE